MNLIKILIDLDIKKAAEAALFATKIIQQL